MIYFIEPIWSYLDQNFYTANLAFLVFHLLLLDLIYFFLHRLLSLFLFLCLLLILPLYLRLLPSIIFTFFASSLFASSFSTSISYRSTFFSSTYFFSLFISPFSYALSHSSSSTSVVLLIYLWASLLCCQVVRGRQHCYIAKALVASMKPWLH